ncbi:hypothetical protein ABH931_001033 [Streptacidiphilus sp. MAP12-33]|uniref:DUF3592 domain-containing protein n=1 Tax=Streptacidiphilus sp. MAP12-33 TaxID=3156266 RepID=UPI0035157E44
MAGWMTHEPGVVVGALGMGVTVASAVVAVRLVKRWVWRVRALAAGFAAEGRVLEVDHEPGDQGREAVTRTVVWFYAHDGREFRVEDGTGRPRVLGEPIALRYLPDRPQWAVVAEEGKGTFDVVLVLVFCTFSALAGVVGLLVGLHLLVHH